FNGSVGEIAKISNQLSQQFRLPDKQVQETLLKHIGAHEFIAVRMHQPTIGENFPYFIELKFNIIEAARYTRRFTRNNSPVLVQLLVQIFVRTLFTEKPLQRIEHFRQVSILVPICNKFPL